MRSGASRLGSIAGFGLAALLGGSSAHAESITGVCPDGSIFIVRSAESIPCSGAKRVEPDAVPPLRPEYLPRPYAWDQFQRQSSQNNPYNIVGSGSGEPSPRGDVAAAPPPQASATSSAASTPSAPPLGTPTPDAPEPTPVRVASVAPAATRLEIALAPEEITQLASIIAAWQEHAPATIVRPGASAPQGMLLRVARSAALEARVAEGLGRRGAASAHGPVLAFHVAALESGEFFGNLTFVQGHVAFHPDPVDATQYGLLSGAEGPLAAGGSVLGYVVLPAHIDLSKPLDIYWDDRRVNAILQPAS